MDELITKSSRKQEAGEIPISTLRFDTCPDDLVAQTHSSRVQVSKPNHPDAQDRNSKSKDLARPQGRKPRQPTERPWRARAERFQRGSEIRISGRCFIARKQK